MRVVWDKISCDKKNTFHEIINSRITNWSRFESQVKWSCDLSSDHNHPPSKGYNCFVIVSPNYSKNARCVVAIQRIPLFHNSSVKPIARWDSSKAVVVKEGKLKRKSGLGNNQRVFRALRLQTGHKTRLVINSRPTVSSGELFAVRSLRLLASTLHYLRLMCRTNFVV